MTKGVRTTLVLLIVFGALVAFVVYTNNADKAEATPAPTSYVWEITTEAVAAVQIVDNAEQTEVRLARDEAGTWQLTSPTAEPADPAQGDRAASLVSTMFVRRTLTETTELREYALLTPLYTLNVTKTDGEVLELSIGLKTLTGDGYYVLRPGDTNAMIVSTTSIDPLIEFIAAPPVKPTETPTPTETPPITPTVPVTPAGGTPGTENAASTREAAPGTSTDDSYGGALGTESATPTP